MTLGILVAATTLYSTGCGNLSAQHQQENAINSSEKADRELNFVYRKILSDYREERIFIRKFRVAHQAWKKYRETHLASIFPNPYKESEYGSAYSECYALYKTRMTRTRTKEIRVWLNGVQEGEVCAGSIKFKR